MEDEIETEALRLIADAIDACRRAAGATRDGFVDDHCHNAIRELVSAISTMVSWSGNSNISECSEDDHRMSMPTYPGSVAPSSFPAGPPLGDIFLD